MESSCPGQGGSATGHGSHLLTLPMLAAQSPVGLEHNVEEGWSMVGVGGTLLRCLGKPREVGVVVTQSYSRAESIKAGRRAWDLGGHTQLLGPFKGIVRVT